MLVVENNFLDDIKIEMLIDNFTSNNFKRILLFEVG
ncbi:hypothetical protein LINPERHAP2_LOCUS12326 [Linum perenne]